MRSGKVPNGKFKYPIHFSRWRTNSANFYLHMNLEFSYHRSLFFQCFYYSFVFFPVISLLCSSIFYLCHLSLTDLQVNLYVDILLWYSFDLYLIVESLGHWKLDRRLRFKIIRNISLEYLDNIELRRIIMFFKNTISFLGIIQNS